MLHTIPKNVINLQDSPMFFNPIKFYRGCTHHCTLHPKLKETDRLTNVDYCPNLEEWISWELEETDHK
jgi:hypothetical protein